MSLPHWEVGVDEVAEVAEAAEAIAVSRKAIEADEVVEAGAVREKADMYLDAASASRGVTRNAQIG
jgi:hypothetical protein